MKPQKPPSLFALAVAISMAITAHATPPPQPLVLISDSIVDDKALVTPTGPAFAGAMNGLSFQHDILVSHNGWQYTAWYDTVGTDQSVWLARRSILGQTAGEWQKFDTGSDLLNGDEPNWDSHNTISIGISRKDGTIHMSWDHHVHNLRYRHSLPGLATYDDSVWNAGRFLAERNWLTNPSSPVTGVTYPVFFRAPDDSLMFNYRTGGSSSGSNWITKLSTTGVNHPSPNLVTIRTGTYTGPRFDSNDTFTSTSRNAYANGFDYDPDGTLHYTWTWRESVVASNHDICYAYSPDHGVTWFNNAGALIADTSLGQRIRVDTPGIVVVPLDGRQQLINQQAQTVDDQGRVHVLVRHRRQEPDYEWTLGDGAFSGPKTAYHHYVRDPATGVWSGMRLPVTHPSGSRPDVETLANGDVYTVFRSGSSLIVAAATAASSYTDWAIVANYGTNFASEPRIDHDRLRKSGVLSVFISEGAPASSDPTPVPLHVIDFATGPVFEAHAGQDQRVTAENVVQTASVMLTGQVGVDGDSSVQSVRWLYDQQVVSSDYTLTITLPVGTHQLVFEATSTENEILEDRVIVEVLMGHGDTIHTTSFNVGLGSSISAYGWTAYSSTGTNLSSSTADPLYVIGSTCVFIGSGVAHQGGRLPPGMPASKASSGVRRAF